METKEKSVCGCIVKTQAKLKCTQTLKKNTTLPGESNRTIKQIRAL